MKWLPGGWQRADRVERERTTVPRGTTPSTMQFDPAQSAEPATQSVQPQSAPGLGPDAQDVDVSAASFRLLLIGGGISGFLTVLCAASLVDKGSSASTWL